MSETQILVVLTDGVVDEIASELAAIARREAEPASRSTGVVFFGTDTGGSAQQLSQLFDDVYLFDDPEFDPPDAAVFASALEPLISRERPSCVLIPHTNNGMDLAPVLAIRTGRPLLTDCTSISLSGGRLSATRPVYGGKVHARVTARASDEGCIVTVRPGSSADLPDQIPGVGGRVRHETRADGPAPRRKVLETVAADSGAVDISQADRLVAVGRGIEDEENLELIRSLAQALGAEIACSRPVVDKMWLEKSRQVGTSGVTVRPSLYLAVGISGSFQHIGGIKGKPFFVAVNKDPRAPIFDVADVGIVGDLFEIVPILERKIREIKN